MNRVFFSSHSSICASCTCAKRTWPRTNVLGQKAKKSLFAFLAINNYTVPMNMEI